ncbi:uncharacterized protein I206_105356 [Kwoniella pini CBS 10737]|uniref:Ig-like domain-containing protein n=1 Tax=Kwoniella pini CBS 10737 TaxID=1296096 RepID=A0A1B9I4G7_9TREE|nr:uncharacterized protein I206_03735 [Kwoniella pini CBS 10737]OCF50413.1 hypothetical protein I206_03735 [Kwoniella pini CBS 10737]
MFVFHVLQILPLIGITSATVISKKEIINKRCSFNDNKVKFEINFSDDAGFEPMDSNFNSTGKKQRGEYTAKFEWNEDDINEKDNTNNPKNYFKFYTYDDDNIDSKESGKMQCTLTANEKPGYFDCLTHAYTLQGKYNWFVSKWRHEEANLQCYLEDRDLRGEADITTSLMPLQATIDDNDDDDDDDDDDEDDDGSLWDTVLAGIPT